MSAQTVEIRSGMSLVYAKLSPKDGGWSAEWSTGSVWSAGTKRECIDEVREVLRSREVVR